MSHYRFWCILILALWQTVANIFVLITLLHLTPWQYFSPIRSPCLCHSHDSFLAERPIIVVIFVENEVLLKTQDFVTLPHPSQTPYLGTLDQCSCVCGFCISITLLYHTSFISPSSFCSLCCILIFPHLLFAGRASTPNAGRREGVPLHATDVFDLIFFDK